MKTAARNRGRFCLSRVLCRYLLGQIDMANIIDRLSEKLCSEAAKLFG
jgi:hypothetical protein